MATSNIILGVWKNFSELVRVEIENVDFESTVKNFKIEALKKLEPNTPEVDLAYCGVILENDKTLSSYGLKAGGTIHVFDKKPEPIVIPPKKLNEAEVQQLLVLFRGFTSANGYRTVLQKLSRPDIIEKLTNVTPGLSEDPAALAILQDPELLVHMSDADTLRKMAEKHPTLIDAANYISSNIQEFQTAVNPNQPTTSTGYSYSLEALSDDDDMDSNSDNNASQNPLSRNASYNAITAAQLAAAIANATNTTFNTNSAGMPTTPTNSNSVITNEMFTNAIQQAFATTPFSSASTPSTRNQQESLEAITRRLQPQLQQMHEMGLLNDSVNVRALQATSGDVQAAIELVFNGVID